MTHLSVTKIALSPFFPKRASSQEDRDTSVGAEDRIVAVLSEARLEA